MVLAVNLFSVPHGMKNDIIFLNVISNSIISPADSPLPFTLNYPSQFSNIIGSIYIMRIFLENVPQGLDLLTYLPIHLFQSL